MAHGAASFDPYSRAPRSGARERRAREFVKARRHTRWVRALRLALPLLALAIAGLTWGSILLTARLADFGFGLDAARLTGDGLSMEAPRITGTSSNGHRFEVEARRAVQEIGSPAMVTFTEPRAVVEMSGGAGRFEITAARGRYHTEEETLRLEGRIEALSDTGYQAHLDWAFIDMRAGTLSSTAPLTLHRETSSIQANGVDVSDNGDTIRFRNGVRMRIDPQTLRAEE